MLATEFGGGKIGGKKVTTKKERTKRGNVVGEGKKNLKLMFSKATENFKTSTNTKNIGIDTHGQMHVHVCVRGRQSESQGIGAQNQHRKELNVEKVPFLRF